MAHTIESATTGRAKCRACGGSIGKGTVRFGERLPNPFGEEGSETTHWYHPRCGAFRRPESFIAALDGCEVSLDDRDHLAAAAAFGISHRRVPRIDSVDRAPSGRARCRACQEMIEHDTWRIGLVFFEEGRSNPGGYLHAGCARTYFETEPEEDPVLLDRLRHFGSMLAETDLTMLAANLDGRETD